MSSFFVVESCARVFRNGWEDNCVCIRLVCFCWFLGVGHGIGLIRSAISWGTTIWWDLDCLSFFMLETPSLRPRLPFLLSCMTLKDSYFPYVFYLFPCYREFLFVFSVIKLLDCLLLGDSFFNLVQCVLPVFRVNSNMGFSCYLHYVICFSLIIFLSFLCRPCCLDFIHSL